MSDHPSGLSRFIAELRRRHVFRATVTYAAVAFIVLQAAEIVVPAFGYSERVLQLAIVASVLGLPLVAALAWVYEITPKGIRTMRELDAEAGIRYPDVSDVFPRVALLVVTVAAVGGAGWWWLRASGPGVVEPGAGSGEPDAFVPASVEDRDVPIRSLAVLPLDNFSPDEGQDYFAAGMHEALISQLSQLGSVRVISRTSVTSYDHSGKSAAQIGRELGVEGLVEGSVTASGDSVRITVQLIHAPSDTHLWAGEYQGGLRDVIGLQREVSRAIAREIEGRLGAEDVQPVIAAGDPAPAADATAAVEELKGRHMALSSDAPEDLAAAATHFEQALREDSSYAPALVGLAGTRLLQGLGSVGRRGDSVQGMEALDSAEQYLERALEADPSSREAQELQALIDGFHRDFGTTFPFRGEGAAPGFQPPRPPEVRVRVQTGDSGVVVIAGDSLDHYIPTVTEIGSRIRAHMARIQAMDGAAPSGVRAARNLEALGHHERAAEILRQTLDAFPDFVPAWEELEHLDVMEGDLDAVVALRRERRQTLGPSAPEAPSVEALERAVARDGATGYWEWRTEELAAREADGQAVSHVEVAAARAGLGNAEEALEHLALAAQRGDPRLATLRSDPVWDDIRDDPRFRRLQRQVFQFRWNDRGSDRGGRGG